jgi:hypothetical protein
MSEELPVNKTEEQTLVSPDSVVVAPEMLEEIETVTEEVSLLGMIIDVEVEESVRFEVERTIKENEESLNRTRLRENEISLRSILDNVNYEAIKVALTVEALQENLRRLQAIPQETQELIEQDLLLPEQRISIEVQQEYTRTTFQLDLTIEELDIPEMALRLVDFQVMCELEHKLSDLYPVQFPAIIRQLVELCEARMTKLKPMLGYEALQKHMLQLYVPYFSCFPYSLNILAMRITAATIASLRGKVMTTYALGALTQQTVKCKALAPPIEQRTLETKIVSSGKTSLDAIPAKFSLNATENLDEEDEVPLGKDAQGHPYYWLALRFTYSIPYKIRRLMAIMSGMPENYKYALYFSIGGLPSRYSTWKMKWLSVPEAKYLTYSRDKTVRDMIIKYNVKRGYFYQRYGKYYKKRRV